MNDKKAKRSKGRRPQKSGAPFTKLNYQLFGLATLVILVGYGALAQGPVDGSLTMTVAPILLVIGYCVLVPLAILKRDKTKATDKGNGAVV